MLGFPCGSTVKNPPIMQETGVRSMGQEDSPGKGNGYLLQYSCLELNPMDGGTWKGTVHGVAESDMTEATGRINITSSSHCVIHQILRPGLL